MTYVVYLLACTDRHESFYIGYTSDLSRRLAEHNAGDGAKYTRGRTPVRVRYVEYWPTKREAMSREWELKQRSRTSKERLVPDREDRVNVDLRPTQGERN